MTKNSPCCSLCYLRSIAVLGARADELRDPTRPATLGPGLVLSSAPASKPCASKPSSTPAMTRRAIVNGKVVREGERVAGVQITAITADSIHYVRAGREHVATLPTAKISVRATAALHAGEP